MPILDRPAEEKDVKLYALPSVRPWAPRFGGKSVFYLSSLGAGDGLWRLEDNQASELWKGSEHALREPAAVSSDGRQAAIVIRQNGRQTLRLVMADGSESRPLAEAIDIRGSAAWSPDSAWIVTGGSDTKGDGLFKIPVGGGPPVRLTTNLGRNPVWSPDGTLIVFAGGAVAGVEPLHAIRPDGSAVDLPSIGVPPNGERVRFLPNGSGLVYMQGSLSWQDFWLLDMATKKTRQLTHLNNSLTMRTFDVTPDGKQIVFDRMRENADVVLIDLPAKRK